MNTNKEEGFALKYNPGVNTNAQEWLNLHRNENLFINENEIKSIVLKAINNVSILKYPDPDVHDLRTKLAELHNVDMNNIFVGNGADEVLSTLFFLFRKKEEIVNLPRVCFKMYEILAQKYNYKIKEFVNFPKLIPDSIKNNSGLFVIDSPGSITGETISKKFILNLTSNPDNVVIWDNVHGDFCDDKFEGNIKSNFIVVKHFSHYYGLAGLRVGYCIASKEIVAKMNLLREPFSVNSIAQASAIECLNQTSYFSQIRQEIQEYKLIFETHLKELDFEISKSKVNFLLVKHKNVASKLIHEELILRKVATRYYEEDSILKDYLRIAIPPPHEIPKVICSLKEIINNG